MENEEYIKKMKLFFSMTIAIISALVFFIWILIIFDNSPNISKAKPASGKQVVYSINT